jgi:hypothetical protein
MAKGVNNMVHLKEGPRAPLVFQYLDMRFPKNLKVILWYVQYPHIAYLIQTGKFI